MKGKGKDKGGAKGKQGSQLKDILPPNAKQPREGEPLEPIEEPSEEVLSKQERHYEYLPYPDFPKWPGNQEVQELCSKEKVEFEDILNNQLAPEDGNNSGNEDDREVPEEKLFSDPCEIYLPSSFHEFERKKIKWLRPRDYLYEIVAEQEAKKNKSDKKTVRKRRTSKRFRLGSNTTVADAAASVAGGVKETPRKKKGSKGLKVNYKVIGYQERPETEEEMKRRKDEEEKLGAKDKKKAVKKGQEEEEPPQMVSVAIETNLDMGFLMPTYSKWMTSQLQFIKDRTVRDTVTKEPIWKRIYPQESGIPCKSLNGKYRVKVRFMGEEKLVEVDDKMPCDSKKKLMLPRTTDFTEIWPQLLIKAYFKLYTYKWYPGAHYDRETGDVSLVYALTGLIGERIKISDFHKEGMNILRKHLSDSHYFNNKTYVMTYCGPTFKPKLPSQLPGNQGAFSQGGGGGNKDGSSPNTSFTAPPMSISRMGQTQKQKLATKLREIASLALSITSGKKLSAEILQKKRQSYVLPGFGYACMDIFENKNVDMDTIIKKQHYDEVKSPFASPSRAERRFRSTSPMGINKTATLKKRKSKNKSIKMKGKVQSLAPAVKKAPPIQYKLIKIKTSVGNYPVLNVNPPFTNTEIKLAKKCRLNRWTAPPPELDPNAVPGKSPVKPTKDFKLEISPIKEEREDGKEDESADGENKEQEKKIIYEPKTRAAGGIWLQAADFPFCFQYFIVFHNDQKIKNRKLHKDIWTNAKVPYKVNENEIYIRLRDPTEEELKAEQAENPEKAEVSDDDDPYKNDEDIPRDKKKRVLVAFAPNPTAQAATNLPRYFCRFDKEKVLGQNEEAKEEKEDNHIRLSNFIEDDNKKNPFDILFQYYFGGQMIELDNLPKFLLKPNMYAPLGYTLWLASESKIDILTKTQFAIEERNMFTKTYQVEQGNLHKGSYCFLFKYDFIPTSMDTECQFKIKTQDKYLYQFMRMKIIDKSGSDTDPNDSSKPLSLSQKLVEASAITTLNSCKTEKITFQPNNGKGYSIICETIPPYDIHSLNLDLEMITNKEDLELERVEMLDPLVYSDVYTPYKYAIIFKEKIYVGQNTSAAFNITLKQKRIIRKEKPIPEGKQPEEGKTEIEPEYEEKEEVVKLLKNFKVQIFDNSELLDTYYGNGHLTVSHFNFRSNAGLEERPEAKVLNGENEESPAKQEDQQEPEEKEYKHYYVIQATFDKNDWPEVAQKESDEAKGISWEMKVYSSDTLAIVKDTDKEDKEKALKESWEAKEPGRAEKSKKSRIRFTASQTPQDQHSEDVKEILKEKRVRGKANLNEAAPDPKAAKGKADKKAPVQEEEVKQEEVPQEFPKSSDYTNIHFRDFIHHFENDRLIHVK